MTMRRLISALGLAAMAPLGLGLAYDALVRRNLFRAGPCEPGVPEAVGVPYEQMRFWTADGQELEGWFFQAGELPATVLFMHGTNFNASDMWATEERAQVFGGFLRGLGCTFFVFDYRGFGPNGGTATEQGTYLDAEGALSYLHNRSEVDPTRIVFYGFSLGTGVAIELATRELCAGLVLRAPFTSIRDLALARVPILRVPLAAVSWLPVTRYDSAAKISRVRAPVLVMHGDADESVPFWMGQRLYELAPGPKRFVPFPGAQHQDFPLEVMTPAIRSFLEQEVAGGPSAA